MLFSSEYQEVLEEEPPTMKKYPRIGDTLHQKNKDISQIEHYFESLSFYGNHVLMQAAEVFHKIENKLFGAFR